jgi:hypothetical protein
MVEHAAGAALGVVGALWKCVRYKFVKVELRLEPGGSPRPKAARRNVAWWGEIVIDGDAPDTIREYQVTLTLPQEVFGQWSIGYPTIENRGGPIWQSRPKHSQHKLVVAGELPLIPSTSTKVGAYEWMLASCHHYQPEYILAYEIAAERRKWKGQLRLPVVDE